MRQKMEYHIISGKVIETRRCWISDRNWHQVRGQRKAGSSSLAKIMANEREKVRRLARILNTNFTNGFMFVTLKYSNERLPADYEAAKKNMDKFLRAARNEYQHENNRFGTSDRPEVMRYVGITANWNPKRNCPARLHHHIVLDVCSMDALAKAWPAGEFHVKIVRNPADLTGLAEYMIRNVHGLDAGKKTWSCCKGMDKPIYTEPKPVDDVSACPALPDTSVVDGYQITDDNGEVMGSYIRAICHEPIRVRGGMVIFPKHKKKMPELNEALAWIRETDED